MTSSFSGVGILSTSSKLAWGVFQFINKCCPQGHLPSPKWAPGRLQKSFERSGPHLGVPRVTESLCPDCVHEKRDSILSRAASSGTLNYEDEKIPAYLLEEAGRVLMRKICDKHGPFEDLLSNDPKFFRRMEALAQGHDFTCVDDRQIHHHNLSTVKYGRGGFLIVDLTNRCNMMCNPCFMDANQVGHVHELELRDIERIFARADSFRPRREVNVLFSGGEPTLSPIFLDAIKVARSYDCKRLHVATNGIRFAQSEDFCRAAKQAGLHGVYLQFDGVSNQANRHRGVGNLFEVKTQAIENIAKAGMRTTLQATVINGVTSANVGAIVDFAMKNIDKISHVIFQPIMFAGRDEEVDPETRYQRRYTLSHLAQDLEVQSSFEWKPLRDWVPLSAYTALARVLDLVRGEGSERGVVSPASHPDYSITSPLVIHRPSKRVFPLFSFFDLERFNRDLNSIVDSGRGAVLTRAQLTLAVLRNLNRRRLPQDLRVQDVTKLLRQVVTRLSSSDASWEHCAQDNDEWTVRIIVGQWFQDLFTYDLRAIEMSATQVGCQDGEIPFCAYNSAGWRQLVEQQNNSVSLAAWKQVHRREQIFAKGKDVPIGESSASTGVFRRIPG